MRTILDWLRKKIGEGDSNWLICDGHRLTVDTVGRKGQPGEKIRKVISVGMLSEGWDAKTVTHIMGLRAFTSQPDRPAAILGGNTS